MNAKNQMTAWDYWLQGNRYYDLREYESAIESYSYAITKKSDIVIFYKDRGYTYAEMGENEKALSFYTKAIELNPEYKEGYLDRAEVYYLMGEGEKAVADDEIAAKL